MNALTQPQRYLAAAQGLDPSVQVSTPDYVSQYTQLPEHWEYDINPGSGNSRATYLGELFYGGQAASNRVATQGDIAAATTGVSSWNTRTGAVTLTLADVTGVGGAPINNTALQGNPTAATQAQGTSNTTLATTAFVTQALANQPGVYSWNGRQGAVTLTLSDVTGAGGAPITSPMFLGTPQAVTAPPGTDNQQLATTAFVMTQMGNSVVSWNGRVGNVTLTLSDVTSVGGAPINAPAFTGVATAVTATAGTSTQQLATTAFVTNAVQAATVGVASFNSRTGAVTLQAADISGAGGALLAGPALTGVPTAPTAPALTNTTQIATCAFVETALAGASVVSSFNTRTGAVTLSSADVANAGALMETGGTMTGNLILNGNAGTALEAVPYQQLTSAIATISIPQASTVAPLMDGTAAVGTGTTWARADHVHPSDTSRLALTGGTLTGTLNGTVGNFTGNLTGGNLGSNGTLTVTGAAQLNSTLGVTGNINTNGNIGAAAITFNGIAHTWELNWSGYQPIIVMDGGNYSVARTNNVSAITAVGSVSGSPTAVAIQFTDGTTATTNWLCYVDQVCDERIKRDIVPTQIDALNVVCDMAVREYWIKGDAIAAIQPPTPPGEPREAIADVFVPIGLVAQEVQPLAPEMVAINQQPEGHDPALPDDLHHLVQQNAVPYLIRAIQQLTDRIVYLETQLGVQP